MNMRSLQREIDRLFIKKELQSTIGIVEEDTIRRSITREVCFRWMAEGGKRLRPFLTIAAHRSIRNLPSPRSLHVVAVAVEALHKASLLHDDIEDHSALRYGKPTISRAYGAEFALNAGDYLVGMGYKLVISQAKELGAACTIDILRRFAGAHVQLSRGQGDELYASRESGSMTIASVLELYAEKTGAAFFVPLYAGTRIAGCQDSEDELVRYSRLIGQAYQTMNDLSGWPIGNQPCDCSGAYEDWRNGRPTLLRAFAVAAGIDSSRKAKVVTPIRMTDIMRRYRKAGLFSVTGQTIEDLCDHARKTAGGMKSKPLADLLCRMVDVLVPKQQLARYKNAD